MIIMTWFDILKKLTRDEYGAVRPYIRDELEEGRQEKKKARSRLVFRLGRPPTDEEIREELLNPTRSGRFTEVQYGQRYGRRREPKPERFKLFDSIKLYLESQNITPTVMNILEELSDSDKTNREKDINDIGEYLRNQR